MKMVKTLTLGFLVLLWAAAAQAGYLTPGLESQISGKSGDEFVKVLVVMNEQVDFRAMDWELHDAKATIDVRHRVVMESLQEQARKSQGDLLAALEANKASGGIKGYTPHWIVNSVVVVGTVDAIRDLATRSDVERIEADLIVELIEPIESEKVLRTDKSDRGIGITPGVVAINAPQVWNDLGVNGAGVVVGILDTGVDGTHPALAARWRGNFAPASECWLDAAGLGYTFPDDDNSHGTHVMGTITGLADDDTIGVAPGAVWIASNVIDSGTGVDFDNGVIASIEFMADPDGNPATTIDMPAVVQNSWGVNENFSGYYDCDSRWWDAIDAAEAAGVCFTWSAGNEGPGSESLRSPGDRAASPTNCFSVGSTIPDPPYTISDFSSRGPSGCGGEFAMKPEISAPGSDIYSSLPGGSYGYKSGTSMAGPHVAGVVALMKASNPNVDVITIKEVIMATATDLGPVGEDNDYGHGLINAYEAVLAVMGGIGTVEGVITDSGTGLPLQNALVRKVGGYNQAYTNASGYFSMTMPIDEVTLSVSKFGYADGTIMTTILEDQVVVENLAIDLLPSGTVSGIVYGPDGNVVENAMVRVAATPLDPVFTDAAGYYSLILPSGAGEFYDIVARASGMGTQAQYVEVLGDLTLDFNLPEWIGDDFETGNFNRFPWEMAGNADWIIDPVEYQEGFNSARSGDIGDNQVSSMSLTLDVLAEGEMKFWYKVSSESGWDYLRFLVDGNLVEEWSGEVDWTEFVHTVQPGARTFTFEYDKDTSVSNGSDCGWIDYMELPAVELPGVPQIAMDTSPVNMALGADSTEDWPLTINNLGDGTLNYALNLTEVGVPSLEVVNPVPHREFGKDEKDEREAVSPVAGYGGPDAFGYSWADSDEPGGPVYSWVDISGDGAVVGSGDDVNHGPFTLQFPFSYYGDVHNSVNVCTNGWLSFTSTSTSYNNQGIPNDAAPNNLLAVFWDDLNPNSGGTIYYKSEPSRFIVQWQDVPHYQSGGGGLPVTFQVILNADGSIIYQYQLIQDIDGSTVGIENAAGDDGLLVCFNDASYLHDGLAIRLAPIPPLTWVTADPLVGTVLEGESQDIILHFDSAGLPVGSYAAMLSVGSNDPAQATVTVPINMIVGGVTPVGDLLPRVVQFTGAVPNPFNPATNLKFSIPRDAAVSLKLYDVSGRLVRSLVNESMGAGHHEVFWNGQDQGGRAVASGTYFARLAVDGVITVKSMALVR